MAFKSGRLGWGGSVRRAGGALRVRRGSPSRQESAALLRRGQSEPGAGTEPVHNAEGGAGLPDVVSVSAKLRFGEFVGLANGGASGNQLFGSVAAQSLQARGRSVAPFRQALAPLALRAGSALAGTKLRARLGEGPFPGTLLQERVWPGWQMTEAAARRQALDHAIQGAEVKQLQRANQRQRHPEQRQQEIRDLHCPRFSSPGGLRPEVLRPKSYDD